MITSVVVLSGKQGSGKSSIQKELIDRLGSKIGIYAYSVNFADILYEMHDAVLSILHKYLEPRKIKKDGPLLQVLGTEWGRNTIADNIWVHLLKVKMLAIQKKYLINKDFATNVIFVIGDCRFENEFNAFPDQDFSNIIKVRLESSEEVRKARCSMWRDNSNHLSEINLDDYARSGKFDLYLKTDELSVDHCVKILTERISLNG